MPFPKQLERHFLSFDIRNLLSSQLLSDGMELLRHIRIGHCTGDIHCPSGFGGFIEPAFILSYEQEGIDFVWQSPEGRQL